MVSRWIFAGSALLVGAVLAPGATPPRSVDEVVQAYVKAAGGQEAIDRIETRETDGDLRHGPKVTYYWQKPDSLLLVKKGEKFGWNGSSGWMLSRKKRVTRLAKGAQLPLETDANPLRFVHLKQMYNDLQPAPAEAPDGRAMDVLVAPNELGQTRFFFDAATHLLVRIAEKGETSAYYEHVTEFADYKQVDTIQLPFHIVHTTTEPGGKSEDLRISKVKQNIALNAGIFSRPTVGAVVLGGKR